MNTTKIKLNPNPNPISAIVTPISVLPSVGIAVPLSNALVLARSRAATVLPTIPTVDVLVFLVVELRELVVKFAGVLLEVTLDMGPPVPTKEPPLGGDPPPTVYARVLELPEITAVVMISTTEMLEIRKGAGSEVSARPYGRWYYSQ